VQSSTRHKGISVVGNILWFILAGWWLALEHLVVGILLCITIIGIPLGVGSFKMAGAALVPFGREVAKLDELAARPADAIAIGLRGLTPRPRTEGSPGSMRKLRL
jgi:uncharacterized membrane protein YccF (DUF307 family)